MDASASVDGDDFLLSVPGAGGALVRTGEGSGPTRVAARQVGPGHLALLEFGFPMVGTAHTEGDHLIVCHMLHTPPGARWDGTDLAVGQSFVYPPGSSHVATDPDGLTFGMAVVPWAAFEDAAATLGYDVAPATRPHVRHDGAALPDAASVDALLDAVVRVACRPVDADRPRGRARWESRDLVEEAAAFLAGGGHWQVPLLTLCIAVGVSERRLQLAFREVYDTTPLGFMRHRSLQAAHRALRAAEPGSVGVATVAAAHGFGHPGRFAAFHRSVFGLPPSVVLGRPAERAESGQPGPVGRV